MLKVLSITAFLVLSALPRFADASHLMGGEITWECIRSGSYHGKFIFTMKLYRYCAGANLQTSTGIANPLYALWGGPSTIPLSQISAKDLSINCGDSLQAMNCYNASKNQYSIEERVYRSSPVKLVGVPEAYPQGTEFGYTTCCRPASVINIDVTVGLGSGYYLRSIMYRHINSVTGKPDTLGSVNSPSCYDASPSFAERPALTLCTDNLYHYSHNAWDPEMDSLTYAWGSPMGSSTSYSTWNKGFSDICQMPDTSYNINNIPASLDPVSGEIKFKTLAPTGLYSTVIKVRAYKGKQLVAEIYRDVGISIISCNNNNKAPIVDFRKCTNCPLIPSQAGDTVYAGDSAEFTIYSTDIGYLPGNVPQKNFMRPSGVDFGYRFGKPDSGCIHPPCAIMDTTSVFYIPSQNYWTGIFGIISTFKWQTDCQHLPFVNKQFVSSSNHTFVFKVWDNFCPVPAGDSKTFTITILAPPPIPPPKLKCSQILGDHTARISWNIPVTAQEDSFNAFRYYTIYRSTGQNGPWTLLDSIDDISVSEYVDSTLDLAQNNYYLIKGLSSCHSQKVQVWSDTISAMIVRGNAINDGNAVALSWTPFGYENDFPATAIPEYLLWEIHVGDTNLIGRGSETMDTLYYHFCYPDTMRYFVEVVDTTMGWSCTSVSNVFEMVLGDAEGPPVQVLDSVSVDGEGYGIAGWSQNPASDLGAYLIGYCDKGSFNIIDTLSPSTTFYRDLKGGKLMKSTSYAVVAMDTCSNSSLKNNEYQCYPTMDLKALYDHCTERILLNWNSYESFQSGSDVSYRIYVSRAQDPWTLIDETDSSFFVFDDLDDSTTFCFYVQAWENGGNGPYSSTSDQACVDVLLVEKPSFSYLDEISVSDNAQVDLCFRTEITRDVGRYNVRRALSGSLVFDTIYSYEVKRPVNDSDSMMCYSDTSAEVSNQYYTYFVDVMDDCGQRIDSSNLGRSILLDVTWKDLNLGHHLTWNGYIDWPSGVKEYKLLYGTDPVNLKEFASLSDSAGATSRLNYIKRLNYLMKDARQYCYQVMALEQAPYFRKNEGSMSYSNIYCLRNRQGLYLPNTFTPNGDKVNDVFRPKGTLEGMKSYHFLIFNRWGEIVYETYDPSSGWDGNFNSEKAPSGSYVYNIFYLPDGKDAEPKELKGKFNLLR